MKLQTNIVPDEFHILNNFEYDDVQHQCFDKI